MSASDEKIHIISCVGYRALAVVTPINTLVKRCTDDKEIEVSLLYTNRITKGEAYKSKEWLENKFGNIKVEAFHFEGNKDFINQLCHNKKNLYYNANPGMNWQIAFLSFCLPKCTKCFSSDFEYLYEWNLMDDLSKSSKTELLNLGIDSYEKLDSKIDKIEMKSELKSSLSQTVKDCLKELGFNALFSIKQKDIPKSINNIINENLIWVKELRGNLYLIFDLHGRNTKSLMQNFRIITEVFDPVNYAVTIVNGNKSLIKS